MRTKLTTALVLSFVLLLVFNVVALGCFIFTPKITAISTDKALNNDSVTITIIGAKFNKKTTAKLIQTGKAEIAASEVKFTSKTEIKATFDVKGKPVGKYDVMVLNSAKKKATLPNAFSLEYPAPVIKSVIPKQGLRKSTLTITIAGTYFRSGATVKLSGSGLGEIAGTNVKVASDAQVTTELNFFEAKPGVYDLTLTNDDGKASTLAKVFALENQPPTIVMIVPNNGINKGFVKITFTGSEFDPKASGKLKTGTTEIQGANTIFDSSSKLSMDFDLTNQPAGAYDVVITNPDGKSSTYAGGFTVDQYVAPVVKEAPKITLNAALQSIFFDFDKSNIRADQTSRLDFDANAMKAYPNMYILIDGHADERGTQEYNLKLAAKRADTVKQALVKLGFDPEKITVNSYGEDFPIRKGHNEDSWWYNRRVDVSMWDTSPASWNNRSESILFTKQVTTIDPAQNSKLDAATASLKASSSSFIILVANSTDYTTSNENLVISQQRLQAVKAYLVKAGIAEERISTIESGKVYSFISNNQSLDSRVDLLIVEL